MTEIITPTETDAAWIIDAFQRRPTKRKNIDIPEYSETTIIPAGKYTDAQFRLDRAPYVKEPLEMLSPGSNIQEVRLMFPAQSGKTTSGELFVMYYIEIIPSEIMHVDSNADQCRIWFNTRISPRATRKGIQFRAQTEEKKSRRSGNTMYAKEFDGGNLDLASALSAAQLASKTKRIIHACEVDRWREELGPEGLTWEIMHARTQAWGDQRKILAESTPTTYESSLIWPLYEAGDQRQFWVKCPLCKEPQILELYAEKKYGLYYETKAGRIDIESICYICPACGKSWKEYRKQSTLNTGKWKPQVKAKTPYIASYNINGIYSPFLTWFEIVETHNNIGGNFKRQQSFDNLKMGRPSKETGVRPKAERIYEMKGIYHAGEVPPGVLFLTIGADVQQGSKQDKDNPPRIELEILGTGPGYRSWSIDYMRIEGPVHNPFSGAWEKLHQWALETGLTFKSKDGKKFKPVLVFIDSGDGNLTSTVYRFTQRWNNTFPIKGTGTLKAPEKGDQFTKENFSRYRYSVIADGLILYTIATNFYKTMIYNNLKIKRIPGEIQSPGFCDFPFEYGQVGTDYEKYFSMLTAEEKLKDGSFHAGGRRNEALDCRVYALCAADVYLYGLVRNIREAMKKAGMKRDEVEKINRRWVIEKLKREAGLSQGY